ncbi:hypothetical protein CICLE_v10012505mg [Citrus x clementina]|uniref:PDZ domain-containing protein n=1 Tax=Citrus clementina TaxID=85681 RepID=V4SM57_CITCL|nr:hypothetical protein CICLE_v10012505mg [Citrus x clementina]
MSSAVVAGASIKISPRRRAFSYSHTQKTTLQGLSLQESKRRVSDLFLAVSKTKNATRSLDNNKITARTAGASKTIEVEVDKPLGLTLGQKPGGGVVITAVEGGGNAAKAGLKSGDQVLYTSSFFGDELWPADKLGFTKTAIQAKPDSVYFVVNRLELHTYALTVDTYTFYRNLSMNCWIHMYVRNAKHPKRDLHDMM